MAITANVIPSDDNSIELALQAFQIGGALTQAAAERAWKVSTEAAADQGKTLAEFAATPEGGDFMRRRFGGILGAIPRGRDPVTGVPRTWAFAADKLVNSLATPATMSADKQKSWAQSLWSSGKVTLGPDGKYKPAEGLSTQESYFAQQAAQLLDRFQAQEETIAQETPPSAPQGQAVSFAGEAKPAPSGQAVTPEAEPAAEQPKRKVAAIDMTEWAAKSLIKPSTKDSGPWGAFQAYDVYDSKGNVIARDQTEAGAKALLAERVNRFDKTGAKADADARDDVYAAARNNLQAAGYSYKDNEWFEPEPQSATAKAKANPDTRRFAEWTDAQLYGRLAAGNLTKPEKQIIQELLDERRKTGQRPQISPQSPVAQAQPQGAAQAAQTAPQAGEKSPAMASSGGQGSIQTAQAGKPAQSLRAWLVDHPELSKTADFNRDRNAPDTPEFVSAIQRTMPMTYRRYQEEMQGNGQTGQNVASGEIGENASYGQVRKAVANQASEAMSEIRRAVPGHRKELNNVLLAERLIPWEAQKYLTGETARKAAEAMPEVEKAKAAAEVWKAKADMFKETSANGRALLEQFRQRLSPWDDQMAQVAKMMATEPKKAKDALDRIIVDMNQNPQVRGLIDGFNTTASWLSDGNLLSVPTIFTAEQKKLFYAWSAASVGTSLQPKAMAEAQGVPQASVPGANKSAADAYEAGLQKR